MQIVVLSLLKTLASGRIWGFSHLQNWIAHGFAWEFLRSGKRYRPGQKH